MLFKSLTLRPQDEYTIGSSKQCSSSLAMSQTTLFDGTCGLAFIGCAFSYILNNDLINTSNVNR